MEYNQLTLEEIDDLAKSIKVSRSKIMRFIGEMLKLRVAAIDVSEAFPIPVFVLFPTRSFAEYHACRALIDVANHEDDIKDIKEILDRPQFNTFKDIESNMPKSKGYYPGFRGSIHKKEEE